MLGRCVESDKQLAVLFIDLDNFKDVNDSLGHEAGDEVLRVVAERLSARLRDSEVVGRMGGDEFVVLAESTDSSDPTTAIAKRLPCWPNPSESSAEKARDPRDSEHRCRPRGTRLSQRTSAQRGYGALSGEACGA